MKEIFVVEDDDGIRELLEFLLGDRNYDVKTFSTVRSFESNLPGKTPDLFLLDMMLPDGNGLDLCKKLKQTDSTRHIPVVLMSAHAHLSQLECADDFIAKPFDVDNLIAKIDKQMNQ